jgi:hypothetical protein
LIPCHRLNRFSFIFRKLFCLRYCPSPCFAFYLTCIAQQVRYQNVRAFYLQHMPRRPPPSPLRLVQGQLPPRGVSKFTMPSIPRPIFHPETMVTNRPVTRQRVHSNRAAAAVGTRELGWRAAEGQESPSPRSVGSAYGHVRSDVSPVDVGRMVMPPRAATCRG